MQTPLSVKSGLLSQFIIITHNNNALIYLFFFLQKDVLRTQSSMETPVSVRKGTKGTDSRNV